MNNVIKLIFIGFLFIFFNISIYTTEYPVYIGKVKAARLDLENKEEVVIAGLQLMDSKGKIKMSFSESALKFFIIYENSDRKKILNYIDKFIILTKDTIEKELIKSELIGTLNVRIDWRNENTPNDNLYQSFNSKLSFVFNSLKAPAGIECSILISFPEICNDTNDNTEPEICIKPGILLFDSKVVKTLRDIINNENLNRFIKNSGSK